MLKNNTLSSTECLDQVQFCAVERGSGQEL